MNNPVPRPDDSRLRPATSGFVLSAAVTVLFSTGLACAKDAWPSFNAFMNGLTGHHWITHGLADLALFTGLGLAFSRTRVANAIDPNRLPRVLTAAAIVAASGLALWYVFV